MAGRPKIHHNQADKQFAYRQRQRAKHIEDSAAWKRVLDIAIAQGLISEEEEVAEQARLIAQYIEDTFDDYIRSLLPAG